mgnify:FL=1
MTNQTLGSAIGFYHTQNAFTKLVETSVTNNSPQPFKSRSQKFALHSIFLTKQTLEDTVYMLLQYAHNNTLLSLDLATFFQERVRIQ